MPRAQACALGLALGLASVGRAAGLPAGEAKAAQWSRRLEALVDTPELASATWGVEVRRLPDGALLYRRNAGRSFTPASVFKLFTTAAALDALGPDDRIRTTLESDARLDRLGRLLGDLHLVGRGDPNLSGRFFDGRTKAPLERLADALERAGVRRIEGRLVGDEGYFQGERRGADWSWDDLAWWYGAEVSALSFNDNCALLKIAPGEAPGDPLVVDRDPVSSYYALTTSAVTTPAGTPVDLKLERASGGNRIRVSGSLPLGAEPHNLAPALEDPALFTVTVFEELLRARGILVTSGVATSSAPTPAGLRVLGVHEGRPLSEVIAVVNKHSQNLHAEMLLRLLGARVKGAGTSEAGREALVDFLRRAHVPLEGFEPRDGSGLSRAAEVTPAQIVALLVHMHRHPHAAAFEASLPVAGVDGSLRARLRGTPAEGRVKAKTGSFSHVGSLAGYATTRDGRRLAFAILLNHHALAPAQAQAAIDKLAVALVQ